MPITPNDTDFFKAVVQLLEADTDLVTLFGVPSFTWLGEAPQGTAFPFAVLTDVSGTQKNESPTGSQIASWVATSVFQVAVYSGNRRQAKALCVRIADALEEADWVESLSFADGHLMHIQRQSRGLNVLDSEKGPAGQDVYSHTIDFRALIDDAI